MPPADSTFEHAPDDAVPLLVSMDRLRAVAERAGLARIGVCDASILGRARTELHRRKSLGLSDTMQFTYRNPERSTDPTSTLPGARSIVVGARSYVLEIGSVDSAGSQAAHDMPRARVAKYAQVDHYAALRAGLEAVAGELRSAGHRAIVVADENNLVDREVAYRAGLGWFGKNANLLLPGAGSWFVLGSVITTADLDTDAVPVADGCGSCRRCIEACPTGAIVADGVIDARRCLAWLVQKPGVFPREFRVDLDDRLYGCDDCQDSCPITVRLGPRHRARDSSSVDRDPSQFSGEFVDVLDLLESSDQEILSAFGRWYIPERDPAWVRRNALIILANVASIPVSARVEAVIDSYLRSSNPFLRAHALWAARRLASANSIDALAYDEDPIVRAEWEALDSVDERGPRPPAADSWSPA